MLTSVRKSKLIGFLSWCSLPVRVYVRLSNKNERRTRVGDGWNMIKALWALGHMPFWFHEVSPALEPKQAAQCKTDLYFWKGISVSRVLLRQTLLHSAAVLLHVNRVLQLSDLKMGNLSCISLSLFSCWNFLNESKIILWKFFHNMYKWTKFCSWVFWCLFVCLLLRVCL